MLKSMTWYGKWIFSINWNNYFVELKSVNNKFFNLNLKTPLLLQEKEIELKQDLAKKIERWSVILTIDFDKETKHSANDLNETLVKDYYRKLQILWDELHSEEKNYLSLSLKMPGIFSVSDVDITDELWSWISSAIWEIFTKFDETRIKEWKILEQDILSRITSIRELSKQVEIFEKERIEKIKSRINGNLEEFVWTEKIDKNRFEQEIIYYLEQIDFTEEKVRLAKHLDYFEEVCKNSENTWKKLEFIVQEINREINTLGSKAREANIQKIVVVMKDELEKIKEQLGNIL